VDRAGEALSRLFSVLELPMWIAKGTLLGAVVAS
jgi:hypothetical protein